MHRGKHWQRDGWTSFALCTGLTSSLQFSTQNPCCRNTLLLFDVVWLTGENCSKDRDMQPPLPKLLPHSPFKSIKTTPDDCILILSSLCSQPETPLRDGLSNHHSKASRDQMNSASCWEACLFLAKELPGKSSFNRTSEMSNWHGAQKNCVWISLDNHSYRIMAIP